MFKEYYQIVICVAVCIAVFVKIVGMIIDYYEFDIAKYKNKHGISMLVLWYNRHTENGIKRDFKVLHYYDKR